MVLSSANKNFLFARRALGEPKLFSVISIYGYTPEQLEYVYKYILINYQNQLICENSKKTPNQNITLDVAEFL